MTSVRPCRSAASHRPLFAQHGEEILNLFLRPTLINRALAGLAAVSLTVAWREATLHSPADFDTANGITAVLLTAALLACYFFPVHMRNSGKIYMNSAILFLMAVMLPPPIAALAAGFGILVGERASLKRTGNPPDVRLALASRTSTTVLLGSLVAHSQLFGLQPAFCYIIAAALMWLADIATFPLFYCPITREPWSRVVSMMVREGGVAEVSQYLIGLLGAFEIARGTWTLAFLLLPTVLVYLAFKNTKEMRDETRRFLERVADFVDERDPYTAGHSKRVTDYSRLILKQMRKNGPEVQLIIAAARVHDIGKIGIPNSILRKDGPLTDDEWVIMKSHAAKGAEIVADKSDFARGVRIIRHHHEAWDGAGYPDGLKATQIPFGARLIAVADTYDALTSDRPYRSGRSPQAAAAVLLDGRGKQWDPEIVDAFLEAIADKLAPVETPDLKVVKRRLVTAAS